MRILGGLIGGLIAGTIGAGLWAGIAYFTGYEIGWIAWGIGALVGLGVLMGWRGGGAAGGVLAVAIALLSILAGKYAAVHLELQKHFGGQFSEEQIQEYGDDLFADLLASEELTISFMADDVVSERVEAGEAVQWPESADSDTPMREADYDPSIWAEAKARWEALDLQEQADYRAAIAEYEMEAMRGTSPNDIDGLRKELTWQGFTASFGLLDVVFFGLAVVTAFKLGASGHGKADAAA